MLPVAARYRHCTRTIPHCTRSTPALPGIAEDAGTVDGGVTAEDVCECISGIFFNRASVCGESDRTTMCRDWPLCRTVACLEGSGLLRLSISIFLSFTVRAVVNQRRLIHRAVQPIYARNCYRAIKRATVVA